METSHGKYHDSNSNSYNRDMDEEEENIESDEGDISDSSTDVSDSEDNSQSNASVTNSESEDIMEVDNDPWKPIKDEAKQRHLEEYEELVENLASQGHDEIEAKEKAYTILLPKLQKELRKVYLDRLLWMRELKKDPTHKKVMRTKESFMDNDDFDVEEATEAAVEKRKFLLNKLIHHDDFYDSNEDTEDISN